MTYYDSVLNTRLALAAAEDAGLDGAALLRAAAIDPSLLDDPFGRVPAARQFALLEAAVRDSGNPAFGLQMARCWNRPGAMDAVGYRIAASGTFRDMIATGYDFLRRLSNLQEVRMEPQADALRIVYAPARADWAPWRVLLDFYMATVALHGRLLVHPDCTPRDAFFIGPAPADPEPYEAAFRCRLNFGHPMGELHVATRWLDAPPQTADRELLEVMGHLLDPKAPEPDATASIGTRAREALRILLPEGPPGVAALARHLQVRPRTLQHQLHGEGLSYQQLVDDVRRELVFNLLAHSESSLDEIAWRAGYRSQSTFFRQFREWTGTTPGAYRRSRNRAAD